MLNIFEYSDYRKYLHDIYKAKKAEAARFSHRYIAQKVGFKSSGFFSLILNGKSNISGQMVKGFIDFLHLSKREGEYFELMVYFNQAKTHDEKERFFGKLSGFKKSVISRVEARNYAYYDKWYYTAIRELLYFHPFNGDYQALGRILIPAITPREAKEAVELLMGLGFVRKNAQGKYVRADAKSVTTGDHVKSLAVENFQLHTMDLGREAMHRFPAEKRNISTLTFGFREDGLQALEAEVRAFRRRILDLAEASQGDNLVYQLNIQLFPLTDNVRKKEP